MFNDDNLDMETTERIQIQNAGNSTGYFKWHIPDTGVFTVTPKSGKVESQSYIWATITFLPQG